MAAGASNVSRRSGAGMERVTEPELMDEPSQAEAYAAADFAEAHGRIVEGFTVFPRV